MRKDNGKRGGRIVRMTHWKKSLWFMVAAEFTVAAQLLLFLPPPSVQAATVLFPEEAGGESALEPLKVETAEPVPQEPVEVNKTVPNVTPPPQYPTLRSLRSRRMRNCSKRECSASR